MLPAAQRLRRKRDFTAVYARKKSWANALLVLYLRRYDASGENSETRRFGFSVSKKVGKAHDRNRVKRRLREICRLGGDRWRSGFDAVLVARSAAQQATFAELQTALYELMRRAALEQKAEPRNPGRERGSHPTGMLPNSVPPSEKSGSEGVEQAADGETKRGDRCGGGH